MNNRKMIDTPATAFQTNITHTSEQNDESAKAMIAAASELSRQTRPLRSETSLFLNKLKKNA
jgi:ADP-ribosylglycohydrolase